MEEVTINHPLYHGHDHFLPTDTRIALSYQRASFLCKSFGITADDCVKLTPKFWNLMRNPILYLDSTAATLISIHLSLCLSSIARFSPTRPDLKEVINKLEKWEYNGHYMVTEIGHGLDAINMETTSSFSILSSGEKGFILHSPTYDSQKWMPPTSPLGKIPKIAVVLARLMVKGENKGIRMFVVPLTNGIEMCKGVSSKYVGARGGTSPLDHALTKFDNVELPLNSLLCHGMDFEKEINLFVSPEKAVDHFQEGVLVVEIGKLAVSACLCGSLRMATYIFGKYSMWRHVHTRSGSATKIPIIQFRTQLIPLAHAICRSIVLLEFSKAAVKQWSDSSLPISERKAVSAVMKQLVNQEVRSSLLNFIEKSGAHGVFEHNHFTYSLLSCLSISIAEGDVGVVGIKIASEILLGKYSLPPSTMPTHPLARHETHLYEEARKIMLSFTTHRSQEFNKHILPLCNDLMRASGFRMAFECALASGVDSSILDLFCSLAYFDDPLWYLENASITKQKQREIQTIAVDAILPKVERYLDDLGMKDYVIAPIVSESDLRHFHSSLPSFVGSSLEMGLFSGKLSKL